jgi:CHASE3 domain sensor protein
MKRYIKDLKFVLFLSLCVTFVSVPPDALALPSESVSTLEGSSARVAQIEKIMSVLESPGAQIHLMAMGISKSQLREQLSQLDDTQLALVSQKADQVKAAGDSGVGIVIGVLLIILLVVVIVHFMH